MTLPPPLLTEEEYEVAVDGLHKGALGYCADETRPAAGLLIAAACRCTGPPDLIDLLCRMMDSGLTGNDVVTLARRDLLAVIRDRLGLYYATMLALREAAGEPAAGEA